MPCFSYEKSCFSKDHLQGIETLCLILFSQPAVSERQGSRNLSFKI